VDAGLAAKLMFEIAITKYLVERPWLSKDECGRDPKPLYPPGHDYSPPQQIVGMLSRLGQLSTLTKVQPLLGQPVPSRTTPGKR
jgi:hypothetical protein